MILEKYNHYKELFNKMLNIDFHNQDQADIATIAAKNFILYSASVVVGRALPDLRDGLKVSQRRALYTMKKIGITDTGKYKKSARVTGTTIALYHPHGDVAVYDTMVNLSQPWKQNLTLIDGQGNWGSIDGDSPANQRYTECRMTKAASILFKDIENDTVDFIPNYDGEEIEPTVLPSPVPMILINGVLRGSIAVGMASSILPHNTTEVINATKALMEKRKNSEEFTAEDFLKYVPAPDFPTGGIVYNTENMKKIVTTGRGSVRVRAKYKTEKIGRRDSIVITEIPWGILKPKLIQEIVDLKNKKNTLAQYISNISDQSDNEIRIVIEVKSGYKNIKALWNFILKNTSLDTSISYYSIVVDRVKDSKGELSYAPREYGLLTILNRYVDHRFEVINRKYTYIKEKSEKMLHIVEGFLKARDIIDEIIALIKKSKNSELAIKKLIDNFEFSREQAAAILAMRLSKLTSIQKNELIDNKRSLKSVIKEAKEVLNSTEKQCDLLIEELEEINKLVGKPRKSEIQEKIEEVAIEEVPKEDIQIIVTNKKYIKKLDRKSKIDIDLTIGDFVCDRINTNTHAVAYVITSSGQVFGTKAYDIPNTKTGTYIKNIAQISHEDEIVDILFEENTKDKLLTLVTENGFIKNTKLEEYTGALRKTGITGISLKEDKVVSAYIVDEKELQDIIVFSKNAKSIKFCIQKEVNAIGRASKGVRAIKLKDEDKVVDTIIIEKESREAIATVTENKNIKSKSAVYYKEQARAGVGVICMPLTKKTGKLVGALKVKQNTELSVCNEQSDNILKTFVFNEENIFVCRDKETKND